MGWIDDLASVGSAAYRRRRSGRGYKRFIRHEVKQARRLEAEIEALLRMNQEQRRAESERLHGAPEFFLWERCTEWEGRVRDGLAVIDSRRADAFQPPHKGNELSFVLDHGPKEMLRLLRVKRERLEGLRRMGPPRG